MYSQSKSFVVVADNQGYELKRWFGMVCFTVLLLLFLRANVHAADTSNLDGLKAEITRVSKELYDISFVANITEKDKGAMKKLDSNLTQIYEFKSAAITFKQPDKLRIEGKLGMVKFEYICNGTTKLIRAPAARLKKREDYTGSPAKLQDALDIGLITPSLWKYRQIEIVDDAEAKTNKEIKLRLQFSTGNTFSYIWLDAQDLWLKRLEKMDGDGKLKAKMVYGSPKKIGTTVWMPTTVEMYTPDGARAAKTQFEDIKYNIGLQDSLFE